MYLPFSTGFMIDVLSQSSDFLSVSPLCQPTVDPSTQTQEDDTPPGTPEEGPESHTSLFSYESTKPDELAGATASEKKARDEDSKRSSLIMNSALEQEISEMEQLDFEEDHLLIYPGADEKYALNPKIEDEETGDEMEAVTAENTKARSGSKEIAVSAERLVCVNLVTLIQQDTTPYQ